MNEEHNYGRGGKVKRNTGRAWPGGGSGRVKTMQTREQQLQRLHPDENCTWTVRSLSRVRPPRLQISFPRPMPATDCPIHSIRPFFVYFPALFHHRPATWSSDISSEKLNLRLTANFLRLFRPNQIDAIPPPIFSRPQIANKGLNYFFKRDRIF